MKKKIFMSVTASTVIASAFLMAEEAEAASHKVKRGDSLWQIAQTYETSVVQLKDINGLTSDVIFPNQVVETSKQSDGGTSSKPEPSKPEAEVVTYTVKSGDTLSGIAADHKVALDDVMKWNELEATLIFPGNKFVVSDPEAVDADTGSSSGSSSDSGSGSGSGQDESADSSGSSTVYRVKSGDSLSKIAVMHGVTVSALKKDNKLPSDLILIGQKLTVGGKSVGSGSGSNGDSNTGDDPLEQVNFDVNQLVQSAQNQLGTNYLWGGQTSSGFDCSGFVHFAYNEAGLESSRTNTGGYYNRSFYVDKPQVGDLVFFEGTYQSGISHMGIYLGNGDFIHAGTSTGVTVSNVSESYWDTHFEGYKRFY